MPPTLLSFDKGTLLLKQVPDSLLAASPSIQWDPRVNLFRAPAIAYRNIVLALHQQGLPFDDQAKAFQPIHFPRKQPIALRPYQEDAAQAWKSQQKWGTVCLPTGTGKTILAVHLILETGRPTLIHVPTIDLMHQWYQVLRQWIDDEIGLLGGGYHQIEAITVATYDSALIHISQRGNQFGLLVFDECHHLPSEQYQYVAISSIAPFRLGLTATPERSDGKESRLYELCGEIVYQAQIHEMEGQNLSPYDIVTLEVDMTPEEREVYEEDRQCYLAFVKRERISFQTPQGWNLFIIKASRSPEGRLAFKAYRRQKQLSQASSAKEEALWDLLQRHPDDRILIFTQDNEMAYRIGKKFLLPVLTHHTKVKEREAFLNHFRSGVYPIIVTSKVLNEGVDVPDANIAIIISGSGSIREHVQRLGRILRKRPGKKAILYEVISKGTGEYYINQRRRQHDAYQRPTSL